MPKWQRTEKRTVRPFPSWDDFLKGVRFKLSAEADFDERTSFDISDIGSADFAPSFLLRIDKSTLQPSSWPDPSDVSLVIRIVDLRLRRSELLFQSDLDNCPSVWAIPKADCNRFSWRSGVDLSVALVLKSERQAQPGQPLLRGLWIARKDFSIRARSEPRAFPIDRWTAEDFAIRGLPRDSVYWVWFITDELNARFDDAAEAFRVCLRADVYDALVYAEKTDGARALSSMIAAEILTEVLWRGLGRLADGETVERGSLLHSAVSRVAKATNATCERLRKLVADGELSSLRAFAQAAVGTRRAVTRLVATQ